MYYILSLLGLILLFLTIRNRNTFIWLPLVFLLLQFIFPFITDVYEDTNFQFNEETSLLLNIQTFIILLLCVSVLIKTPNHKNKYLGTIPLIIFAFLLLFITASDMWFSFKAYIRFLSVLLILPASYNFFQKIQSDILFYKIIFFTNVIAIIYIIYCSIFQVGFPYYRDPILFYGGLRLFGFYLFVFSIPLFFIMLSKRVYGKFTIIFVMAVMVLLILLSMKRSFILIAAFQFLLYFSFFVYRRKYLSGIIAFSIVLFILTYAFSDEIKSMVEVRALRIETGIQEEGRYLEFLILYDEQVRSGDAVALLLGKDLFKDKGNFGKRSNVDLKTEERYLHSDFALLFFSLGLIGFLIYLRVFYILYRKYKKFRKITAHDNEEIRLLSYAFLALFTSLIINSAIDGFFIFFSRSFSFYVLGFILARFTIIENNYQIQNHNKIHLQ